MFASTYLILPLCGAVNLVNGWLDPITMDSIVQLIEI
jgi:hypothetical protein